jgi:hypothetical protein
VASNKVYTRQPGAQRGGGVSQAEPGTSAKDTWPIELSYVYTYQLATQIEDRQGNHPSQHTRFSIHILAIALVMEI